jgi:antitoxin MazE
MPRKEKSKKHIDNITPANRFTSEARAKKKRDSNSFSGVVYMENSYYICNNICNTTRKRKTMRTSIIKIGNSSGIIIPRGVMRTLGLTERSSVTMQIETDVIVIKKTPARSGWEEAAQKMRMNGDDELLLPDVFEDEVFEEW